MSDTLLKSFYADNGDLVIQGVGLPFGSPEHRDLHGDFADEQTDTGGLPIVFSYFDHRKSFEWLPKKINPFLDDPLIGYAKSVGKTADGLVYDIIVDRNKKYKSLIKKLADDGFLKLSSEVKFREDDPNVPGRLKRWHITAVDLTPTAASPDAEIKAVYEEMAKSISLPEDKETMADNKQPEEIQNGSGEIASESLADRTAKRFAELQKSGGSMPDTAMKKKMTAEEEAAAKEDAADGGKDDAEENPDGTKKTAKSTDITPDLATLIQNAVVAAVAPISQQIEAINSRSTKTEKSVGEIIEAFDVLSENVVDSVRRGVAQGQEEGKKSNLEKRIETKTNKSQSEFGSVPASWPGAGK